MSRGHLNEDTANYWPDVPWDRICAEDTNCKLDQAAPSFWTRKRLTKITTEIRSATAWTPVDSWTLDHWFTDNGDGSKTLWLNKITHAGHVGGTAALPAVELIGEQLPNRIDKPDDNIAPLIRFRVNAVNTDTGAQIDVNYADRTARAGNLPRPGASTKRCYPGQVESQRPAATRSPTGSTSTSSRRSPRPTAPAARPTWSPATSTSTAPPGARPSRTASPRRVPDLGRVARLRQGPGHPRRRAVMTTRTDHTFFRGMDGDPLPGGGTQDDTVTDSTGAEHDRHDEFAGTSWRPPSTTVAAVVAKTITVPWLHQTGTQTDDLGHAGGPPTCKPGTTRSFTALEAGGWRETKTVPRYDTTSRPADARATTSATSSTDADDQCTRTQYADNANQWLANAASAGRDGRR